MSDSYSVFTLRTTTTCITTGCVSNSGLHNKCCEWLLIIGTSFQLVQPHTGRALTSMHSHRETYCTCAVAHTVHTVQKLKK